MSDDEAAPDASTYIPGLRLWSDPHPGPCTVLRWAGRITGSTVLDDGWEQMHTAWHAEPVTPDRR